MTPRISRTRGVVAVFALTLLVYMLTKAPGLTWQHRGADGGDFLAAAATMGVAHPAGYPTYTMLLRLMMYLPVSNPAAAGSLLSALMGATASALCFATIRELLGQMAHSSRARHMGAWAAAGGALTFAFNPLVWSQALITEVYSFHLALSAAAFWLLLRWRRTGRGLYWAALVIGLAMTNHLTAAFLGPAALTVLVAGRRHLIRASWSPMERRSPPSELAPLPSGRGMLTALRKIMAAGGAFVLGLAPYAYIPWAARRMPPVNWENPQNWEGFRRLVLATRYSHNVLEALPSEIWGRLTSWTTSLPIRIYWPVYVLCLVGILWLLLRDPAVGAMTGTYAVLAAGYAVGYGTTDYWVNLLPAIMMVAIWLAVGIWLALRRLDRGRWRRVPAVRRAALLLMFALPAGLLLSQWAEMDIHKDHVAEDWVDGALKIAEEDALIFTRSDQFTFGLWYGCYVLDARADLTPILPTFLQREWYRDTLAENHQGLDLRPTGLGRDALLNMIRRHIDDRPIYLTWDDEATAEHYDVVSTYPLWRVDLPLSSGAPPHPNPGLQP